MREARRTRGARRSAAKRRRRTCGPSRHGEELPNGREERERESGKWSGEQPSTNITYKISKEIQKKQITKNEMIFKTKKVIK